MKKSTSILLLIIVFIIYLIFPKSYENVDRCENATREKPCIPGGYTCECIGFKLNPQDKYPHPKKCVGVVYNCSTIK